MKRHEIAIYMLPSPIMALLNFDYPMVVEFKVILEDLWPFILEVQFVHPGHVL